MPNQMIALQARNPQLPDPSRQTAQYANMMNMARQQEAAQRQAQQAQQAMTIAAAKEGRDVDADAIAMKKAGEEYVGLAAEQFRQAVSTLAEGDIAGAEAARADIIAKIPDYGKYIRPASEWTREYRFQLMSKAKEIVDKTIATPVASLELSTSGAPRSVTVGGLNPEQRPVYDAPNAAPAAAPTATPTNPMSANAPAPNAAAAEPGSLGLVIASALETGIMAQADLDQMLSKVQPESRPKIMNWVRQNNIQVAPNTPALVDNQMRDTPLAYDGQTPESQFAVYRGEPMQSQTAGLRGAPPMEQTLAQTRTSTPLQMRNPNVSTAPAETPEQAGRRALLGRATPAEEAAKTRATKLVDIEMAPQLATATKTAERVAELKIAAPKARNATLSIIADIDDRINTIDEFLRSPNRHLINGPIEGNLPRLLQTGARADAQAAFDKIKNTATLTSLIDLRKSTETGASPVGANPTDRDARIVEQAASKLIQTGELSKMDAELIAMRKKLYRTRVSAASAYDAEYGDAVAGNPRLRLDVPAIADRYIRTTGSGKKGTSTKVDRNNPLLRGM